MRPKSTRFGSQLHIKAPALLCVALLVGVAAGQTKDNLVGTWRLVSAWTTRPNGERVSDYGEHPVGFLTYTREGRMIAVVGDGDRKPLSGDRLSAPAAERAEAFSNFLAYAGRYTFDGDRVCPPRRGLVGSKLGKHRPGSQCEIGGRPVDSVNLQYARRREAFRGVDLAAIEMNESSCGTSGTTPAYQSLPSEPTTEPR